MRISQPSPYAKPPPVYSKLSVASRAHIDRVDPRHIRPSELKALALSLHQDDAISASQKMELDMIRRPYDDLKSDEPLDLVAAMEHAAISAPEFERYIPGSGCSAYYREMVRFARWMEATSSLHRKAPLFSGSA